MANFLDNFKSKITWKSKTTYGIMMIILGLVIWGVIHNYVEIIDILVLMIPSILLVLPYENVRNSRILGIFLAFLLVIVIILSIINLTGAETYVYTYVYKVYGSSLADSYYSSLYVAIVIACIAQIVYAILNLFSAFMLTVPTEKE